MIRTAIQYQRARAGTGSRADQAIRSAFSQGGACFDCHEVTPPTAGGLNYGIRPVAFPTRYMTNGWFDHRPHQIVQRPGQPQASGPQACVTCHRATTSNSSADLLLPNVASCRDCHGGETTSLPVPSTCAMCHDYHNDAGTPAFLLRRTIRGQRWETTVTPVTPVAQQGTRTPPAAAAPGRS
jgi:hypothetical protein